MRHDAGLDADVGGDLVQYDSKLGADAVAATRARQKKAVGTPRVLGAQQLEAMHDASNKGIHRHQTFRAQLAQRHMKGPLILTGAAQTIKWQVETFADAHTCVAQEQQSVAGPVVTTQQLP